MTNKFTHEDTNYCYVKVFSSAPPPPHRTPQSLDADETWNFILVVLSTGIIYFMNPPLLGKK